MPCGTATGSTASVLVRLHTYSFTHYSYEGGTGRVIASGIGHCIYTFCKYISLSYFYLLDTVTLLLSCPGL